MITTYNGHSNKREHLFTMFQFQTPAPPSSRLLLIWVALFGFLSAVPGSEGDGSPVIFYSNYDSIRYIGVNDFSVRGTVKSDLTKTRALALYVAEGWIFWSEKDGTEISRLRLPDGTKEVILHRGEVRDIAFEWESELLYWTDHMYETIEVARMDGSFRRTLISGQVVANPLAIAVDPQSGYMFWSEMGWDMPSILRATLAGTEIKVIVDEFPGFIPHLLITGLVIDYSSNVLYWDDAQTVVIEHTNFDGSERETVHAFGIYPYPYRLTLYRDMLYISDLTSRSIERVNLTTAEHLHNMGWLTAQRVYGIALNDSSREPPGKTDCKNNSECSHLCLLTPSGYQCACPDGYELQPDNNTCNATVQPTRPAVPEIEIRLMIGNTQSVLKGRVEVRYDNESEWGTVCDDHFDMRDAKVVCRMLNHSGAVSYGSAYFRYGFGTGSDDSSILLDNLKCRGDEASLMECKHKGWDISDCGHFEDVAVVCKNESITTVPPNVTSPTIGPPANFTIRLRGGLSENEGRVEIVYNGTVGTICDNDFDINDANVICKMLGFEGAWSTMCCGRYGYGYGEIWLDNLQCSGNETTLSACPHLGWGNHGDVCSHFYDAGVFCIPKPIVPPDSIIRLVDGTSENQGRVEIYHDKKWGTICDDRWDLKDATVICRMLNYSGALAATLYSSYDAGSGKIWLDETHCVGNESSIEDCPHGGWGNHDCDHFQDAGVICQANDSALPVYDLDTCRKMLVFSEYWRSVLFQVCLVEDVYEAAPLPIDNTYGLTAVGFDPIEHQVYYGHFRPGYIERSSLNGTGRETIINGIYHINRLAIDHVFRTIYFTDSSRYRIDVANLDGMHRKMLISTPWPEDIALDLENGTIYWTSNGYPPRIEKADMDGKNMMVIRNLTYDSYPSGLAFVSSQKRLYWTDINAAEVYYLDLVANQHGTFISNELYDPIDLAILGNQLYVTDVGSGEWDGGIYSALLGGSGNVSKVIDLLKYTWAITSYDADSILQLEPRGCQLSKCSHLCLNSPNEPQCACPNDMMLINSTTCVYQRLILYTECFYSEIYKAPLGGDDLFSVANTLALENPSCPSAIASNPATEKIYWTDTAKHHIARANLDGTGEEIILENVTQSRGGLVVNSRAGNIYFTDNGKKTLEVAKLDGSCRKVLIQSQTHELVGLAIDPMRGYMYYSAWGDPTKIERAQMDGSDRITLVEWVEWPYQRPTALAIDIDENVLYWVGDLYPSLQYIDLRYPHSEIVHHIEFSNYLHWPFGLALDAHYFYWTDGLLGNVIRASRGPNPEVIKLIPYQLTPRGVNIYNPDDIQEPHPCVDTCSHLCLLKPGGYKCVCSDDCATPCNESIHVTIPDTCGCTNDPSLYFIDKHHIKCIDLESSNQTYVSVKTVRSDLIQGGAIDIHHLDRMIYWSDNGLWTINRMSLITCETEVIIRRYLGRVLGLAVDWECGLIYWVDFVYERIEVAQLDGSHRKTLFSTGFYSPRGIAVAPMFGYMFWTEYGFDSPRIERADLTGDNRTSLVSFGIDWYYQFYPVSVVIEYQTQLMYWIDERDNYIDHADIHGNNKANLGFIAQGIRPQDLALYKDTLYWADMNSHSIQYVNKTQEFSLTNNFGHLSDDYITGCVVSDESRQPVASPMNRPQCRINKGGCSHLCLPFSTPAPGGRCKCACPNGVELEADNKTCSNATTSKPPPTPVPDLKVRLSGSNSSHEGRVEVYFQGQWGTVCDDHWGMQEATIVCKMLNFSGAFRVDSFGPGNSSSTIWMDNVKCRGDELSIAACRHRGWGESDCSHYEDAGVVCRNNLTEGPTLSPGPHPELKVRLRSGMTSNEGRVELFLNGTWGTICGNDWGIKDADVICRMLGYTLGAWSTHCCGWYSGLSAPNQIWLDRVDCVGDETSIAQCRHGGWGSHNCDHSDDVGVVCKYTQPPTPDQKLRLAEGIREGEGRVEIFHDGHWGTVCDDYWDIKDAQVVCNELGYREALAAPKFATFDEGNGHIWLSNVHCVGNESSLEDCEHSGYDNHPHFCQHYEDASVICWNESRSLPADDFLIFYEGKRGLFQYVSLPPELLPVNIVPLSIDNSVFPYESSYDPVDGLMYWTSYGNIYRASLYDGSPELVISGVSFTTCFGIDVVGRNMYFCDYYSGNVRVASLDGKLQANVVEIPYPQGIVVDSETRHIFYTAYEISSSRKIIYQADMDGKNEMVIANMSLIADAYHHMAMDYRRRYLYVADNSKIRYIKLNNSNEINTLFHEIPTPTNIQISNAGILYWVTQGDGGFDGVLFSANLTDSAPTAKPIADGLGEPSEIYVNSSLASQISADSPCRINNGGCSQLCVLNPKDRSCFCHAGMKVADDGISCTVGDVIFVTDLNHQKILYSPINDNILSPLPFSDNYVKAPIGIAFDPCDDHLYWTDSEHSLLARSTIDGTRQEIIRSNVTEPTGMDLDLVGGHVYWINSGKRTIEVSKLNGDYWKVLVSNLTSGPVDIAVDPTRGKMYWSAPGIIEGAEMDGSNRRTIALLGETYYGSPVDAKGLTVDVPMNRLYFVSYEKYSLLYIDLASGNDTVETLLQHFWLFYGPYGITISGDYVYWSEYLVYGRVFRTNKTSAGIVQSVVQGLYSPRGIAVKEGNCTLDTVHPCSTNTSGCTHLCLIIPSGYKCDCPEIIDDGRNCTPSFVTWPPTTRPPTTATKPPTTATKPPTTATNPPTTATKPPTAATKTPNTTTTTPPTTTTKPPTTTTKPPTTTTKPPTTTTKPPSTTPVDHCAPEPCQNGATCEVKGDGYKCDCLESYVGETCSNYVEEEEVIENTVVVTFNMTLQQYDEDTAIDAFVDALNAECTESQTPPPECSISESTESIAKRAVAKGPFTREDIVIRSPPKEVDGGISVEFAVVKTSADGTPVVVPNAFLTAVTQKRAAEIGKKVGGNVLAVRQKPVEKVTSKPQTGRSNGGLIAGVIVSVGLIVIVTAITIWYFRIKKTGSANIPYVKEDDDQTKNSRTTAFENPGYDSTGAYQGGAEGNYDDLGPVVFSPFEETTESGGAANPVYAEIGMTRMSSSQDINTDGAAGMNEAAGELHKKVPDHVEITVQKEAPAQEEARYVSMFSEKSKEAKNDQTTVEVEKEEQPRYQTLADAQSPPSDHQETDQTVVVLDDNNKPTAE